MTRRDLLQAVGGLLLLPGRSDTSMQDESGRQAQAERKNGETVKAEVVSQEFTVPVGERALKPRLLSPPNARLAKKPLLLLNLAADRETNLTVEPYCLAVDLFTACGHRALSFDLPNHGARIDRYGEGIAGWRNAFVAGQDVFTDFTAEASAVIDHCIQAGWAEPGRIVVYGISRGGYLALRLLAADSRIAAAAAIAPVTDWRELREFAADRSREDVAALRLSRYADALAGKPIFMVIGNSDDRVGTLSCSRFFLDLQEAGVRHGHGTASVEFACTPDVGHSVADSRRRMGAEFLFKRE